jgi:ribosomal protein S18 acetylase RimI-like enzyme
MADIDELTRLFDGYRMFYEQSSDLDLARSFVSERIEKNESTIFVSDSGDGSCCGFTQLFRSFSSVSARPIWILNDLFVEKTARKQGVGRMLMNKARDFARETAAKGILLETANTNVNAQALYESLDYRKNTDSFFYFLDLSQATSKLDTSSD